MAPAAALAGARPGAAIVAPVHVAGGLAAVSPVVASAPPTVKLAVDPSGAVPFKVILPRGAAARAPGEGTTAKTLLATVIVVIRVDAMGLAATAKATPAAGSLVVPTEEAVHAGPTAPIRVGRTAAIRVGRTAAIRVGRTAATSAETTAGSLAVSIRTEASGIEVIPEASAAGATTVAGRIAAPAAMLEARMTAAAVPAAEVSNEVIGIAETVEAVGGVRTVGSPGIPEASAAQNVSQPGPV